jgi:membrane-anchored mycosin MYCP
MNPKMLGRKVVRVAVLILVTVVAGLSGGIGAPAAVAAQPMVNPALLPADGTPAPPYATEPANPCSITRTQRSPAIPPAQAYLGLQNAWKFSRGAGQRVAVIDTGVSRHTRLNVVPGGDYVVAGGNGTDDCDSHGTAVAGIIAGQPSPGDGFSGVAPDAQIIAIRQTSEIWRPKGTQPDPNDPKNGGGVGNTTTLGEAIRHAADLGATVINISEVACGPAATMNDGKLGAAVQYAAEVKDVVIVAAAGNNDNQACKPGNPGIDPLNPSGNLWDKVTTAVTPAWYDNYVLAVGSVNLQGAASSFSVPGPWVGVAAPGEQIVSLDSNSAGLIFATQNQGREVNLAGTSFAAPYVAGVAALVRAHFPQLSAAKVIKRIEATAHAPAEGWNPAIGFGIVDPVAALTDEVSPAPLVKQPNSVHSQSVQLPVPATPPPPDNTARNVALIGAGVIAVLLILGYLASFPIRYRLGMRD